MTTTGTTLFNFTANDLYEEAFERIGIELRTGYQYRSARRSMSLLLAEMANMGLNLWTVDTGTVPLLQNVATYQLPADTVDLIEHVVRQTVNSRQTDINITRISVSTYAVIPDKANKGRPTQIYIDRQRDNPQFSVWPVPEDDSYTLVYWRLRRLHDAGSGETTFDVPFRYYNAVVAGLAYHLAMKYAPERMEVLKIAFNESLMLAQDEDRDRSDIMLLPKIGYV